MFEPWPKDEPNEYYIVFTQSPTGNCWATNIKVFYSSADAIRYAKKEKGLLIKTDYLFEGYEN